MCGEAEVDGDAQEVRVRLLVARRLVRLVHGLARALQVGLLLRLHLQLLLAELLAREEVLEPLPPLAPRRLCCERRLAVELRSLRRLVAVGEQEVVEARLEVPFPLLLQHRPQLAAVVELFVLEQKHVLERRLAASVRLRSHIMVVAREVQRRQCVRLIRLVVERGSERGGLREARQLQIALASLHHLAAAVQLHLPPLTVSSRETAHLTVELGTAREVAQRDSLALKATHLLRRAAHGMGWDVQRPVGDLSARCCSHLDQPCGRT